MPQNPNVPVFEPFYSPSARAYYVAVLPEHGSAPDSVEGPYDCLEEATIASESLEERARYYAAEGLTYTPTESDDGAALADLAFA